MKLADMDDVEQFQRMFVKPLVDAVRAEMQPLCSRVEAAENDLTATRDDVKNLKANQAKALVGWTVLVSLITAGFAWAKARVFGA